MGRPRLPAEVKRLHGEDRPSRLDKDISNNDTAGTPVSRLIDAHNVSGYNTLTPRGRRIFTTACKWAIAQGTLRQQDLPMMVMFASEYDLYLKASRDIEKEGLYVTKYNEFGEVAGTVTNPAIVIRNQAGQRVSAIGAKFGFTPRDRISIAGSSATGSPAQRVKSIRQEIIYDTTGPEEQS